MIPSVLSSQLRRGVEEFLRTTFPISTPLFENVLGGLFKDDEGIFKGPYLSVQHPFREGKRGANHFPEVPLSFTPYEHQEKAFLRLGREGLRQAIEDLIEFDN